MQVLRRTFTKTIHNLRKLTHVSMLCTAYDRIYRVSCVNRTQFDDSQLTNAYIFLNAVGFIMKLTKCVIIDKIFKTKNFVVKKILALVLLF